MTHTDVQERLLLYLDGDLPEEQIQRMREHLSDCTKCARQRDLLAGTWLPEIKRSKLQPSPVLWTKLIERIEEYEHIPAFLRGAKGALQTVMVRPIAIPAAIAALLLGMYLGTPPDQNRNSQPPSSTQPVASGDDLGLDQFDVIPPAALGSALLNVLHIQK